MILREIRTTGIGGYQYDNGLGDIPKFTWQVAQCSGESSALGEGSLSDSPASGTFQLCDLGPVAFPL